MQYHITKEGLYIGKKNLKSFYSAYQNEFLHYIDDIIYELESTNKEYKSILDKIENELDKHPRLRQVIDEDEVEHLSNNDIKSFLRIKELFMAKMDIERKEIFFRGGSNAYYYFNMMKLLKESDK